MSRKLWTMFLMSATALLLAFTGTTPSEAAFTPPTTVYIPAGSFLMGSPESDGNSSDYERPQHQVSVSAFYMGKYEVTNSEFCQFLNNGNSIYYYEGMDFNYSNGLFASANGKTKCPANYIGWDAADAYCKWLSAKTGETYRLPTEAEWEYACRAGTTTRFYWGDTLDPSQANVDYSVGQSTPVGSYPANKFGLYDMTGNALEWCYDWYATDYYASSPATDPTGPANGTDKVLRGGAWTANSVWNARSSARMYGPILPTSNYYDVGFRIVKGALPATPPPTPSPTITPTSTPIPTPTATPTVSPTPTDNSALQLRCVKNGQVVSQVALGETFNMEVKVQSASGSSGGLQAGDSADGFISVYSHSHQWELFVSVDMLGNPLFVAQQLPIVQRWKVATFDWTPTFGISVPAGDEYYLGNYTFKGYLVPSGSGLSGVAPSTTDLTIAK